MKKILILITLVMAMFTAPSYAEYVSEYQQMIRDKGNSEQKTMILSGWLYKNPEVSFFSCTGYDSEVVDILEEVDDELYKVKVLRTGKIGYCKKKSVLIKGGSEQEKRLSDIVTEDYKSKGVALGFAGTLQIFTGIAGTVFTIISANKTYEYGEGDFKIESRAEWAPIHTATITLSIGAVLSGIAIIAAAN